MPGIRQLRDKKVIKHRNSLSKSRSFFRPRLEALEDRCVPATVNVWSAPAGPATNWNTAANWSLGHVPTSSEIATFNSTSQTFCLIDASVAGTNTVSGLNITAQYSGQIQDTADMIIGTDGFAQAGGVFSIDFFMPGTTTITDAGNWSEAVPPPFGGFRAGPGATVDFNSSTSQTILDNNTQFFNLTHSGSGTLNLTAGPNPFLPIAGNFTNSSGTVDAQGASLVIGGNWNDTSSIVNLNTVMFVPFSPTPQTISSNSNFNNLTFNGPPPALLQLLTPVTLTGNFTVTSGTFDANHQNMTVAGNWSNAGTIQNTATVTFNGGSGTTQTLDNGSLAAGNSLNNVVHSGAGTLQLSNNSLVMTGTLSNSAGTLEANGLNMSIAGLTTLGAGTVQNTGAADTITLTGGLNLIAGTLSTGSGMAVLGADVTATPAPFTLPSIDGNLNLGGVNRTFTVNLVGNTSGLYIDAAISNGALTKDGGNALALRNANSYSGGTTINAGEVFVYADQALGPGTGGTTVAGGAALGFINDVNYTAHESVTLNGGAIDHLGIGTVASFSGPITLGAAGSFFGPNLEGVLVLNGPINAAGFDLTERGNGDVVLNGSFNGTAAATLSMQGTGSLTLNAANNYGGGTTVSSGTLIIGNDSALGSGPLSMADGTTIENAGAAHTLSNNVTLNGTVTVGVPFTNWLTLAGIVSGGGSFSINGGLVLTAANLYTGGTAVNHDAILGVGSNGALGPGSLALNDNSAFWASAPGVIVPNPITLTGSANIVDVPPSNPLGLSGNITGSGALIDQLSSNLDLKGNNSYSGGTTVLAGTLTVFTNSVLGTGPVTLDNGSTLSPSGGITLNNAITTINGGNIRFHAPTDSFVLTGVISGMGGLNMVGANGILTLTANNTYSGTTSVNAGVLTLTGSIPNSAVVLNTGGIVGHGTTGPLTVNDGAFVDPSGMTDVNPGVLTTGNVQFNGGLLEISVQGTVPGTGYSQLHVNGTVNLGNGVASLLDFTPLRFARGTKLRLIDNDGTDAVSGFFVGLPEGSIFTDSAGNRFQITYQGGDGNDVVLTTVSKVDDLIGRVSSNGQWWLNTSTGSSFTTSQPLTWSTAVTWVNLVTGDFNGDGFADIAGRVKETGDWWVSLANGSGGFTTSRWDTWSTGATWVDVQVGDFSGDGKADIVGRDLGSGTWWVGLSTGSSFRTTQWAAWSTAATWVDVKVGDFNGDGKADITGRYLQGGSWWTGLSNGSTAFNTTLWATWSTAATWVDAQVGDFNGDGMDDITARYKEGGTWWTALSNGTSFVTSPAPWATWSTAVTWVDVHVGDFNGDGKADIIGRALENGQWYVGLSNGSNIFTTSLWDTWSTRTSWVDVQVGDFNGDGKADIGGRASQNGQWYVGLSNGSAFSTSLWTVWSTGVSWVDVREGAFV